jgi:hypothetical protein
MLVVVVVMFNTDPAVAVLVALVVVATVLLLKAAGQLPMEQMAFQTQVVVVVVQFIVLRQLQHSQQDEKVEAAAE